MTEISNIDKNFVLKKTDKNDIKFYSADDTRFSLHGIFREGEKYVRIPSDVAAAVNDGVSLLNPCTAGGRLRFVTDSPYVSLYVKWHYMGVMPHMTKTGSHGFDMYDGTRYMGSFPPPVDSEETFESVIELRERKERTVTINFPLYCGVKELYIGLEPSAYIKSAASYINAKPVVYYGSSITQGGCASRPGMSYQEIVSRRLNIDYVNLGFSGAARAENEIVNYIKNLDMSVFVYDYDNNAPSAEYLKNTHEKMFAAVRKQYPDIPIILMPRPKVYLTADEAERRKIIETTYNNAIAAGDKNVYFIAGEKLTELCGNDGTVDGTHPTDFGFASMAKAVGDVLEKIIKQ